MPYTLHDLYRVIIHVAVICLTDGYFRITAINTANHP